MGVFACVKCNAIDKMSQEGWWRLSGRKKVLRSVLAEVDLYLFGRPPQVVGFGRGSQSCDSGGLRLKRIAC